MTDKMRWRYGDTNPVVAAVRAETVIEIGDLLWQDGDDAEPASECESVAAFKQLFLGVAMQRSRKGDLSPIRVATTGIFEFDCEQDCKWNLGDFMTSGDPFDRIVKRLPNQKVGRVFEHEFAIGRVDKRKRLGEATVYVRIASTVMTGGV